MSQILKGIGIIAKIANTTTQRGTESQLSLGGVHETDKPSPRSIQLPIHLIDQLLESLEHQPLIALPLRLAARLCALDQGLIVGASKLAAFLSVHGIQELANQLDEDGKDTSECVVRDGA